MTHASYYPTTAGTDTDGKYIGIMAAGCALAVVVLMLIILCLIKKFCWRQVEQDPGNVNPVVGYGHNHGSPRLVHASVKN